MYVFDVCQCEIVETLPSLTNYGGKDLLPIKFGLFTLIGRRRGIYADPDEDSIYEEPNLITERRMLVLLDNIKLISRRDAFTGLMARYLSDMGIPDQAQPTIIEDIFKVVDVAVPKLPILVSISETTVVDSRGLFPATKPAIRGLERVRLDSFDEATIRRTPSCAVCLNGLDRQDVIIQLPCSHIYHGDCIVTWLETSHLCPVCRYSMPYVLECQQPSISGSSQGAHPAESSSSGQGANPSIPKGLSSSRQWMIYAGGIVICLVTVTLLCRSWKQS